MTTRSFHLGDILSVTTGRMVSPRHVDGLYDLLGFMAGESVWTHQLPRVSDECAPELLRQHPDLAEVQPPEHFRDEAHVWEWLAEQTDRFGMHRDVAPLKAEDHTSIDPMAEIRMVAPHLEVIEVEVPNEELS